MHKKGFSLIEMVVVIAIIAILLAIVVPLSMGAVNSAKQVACDSNCDTLRMYLVQADAFDQDLDTVFAEQAAKVKCPFGGTYHYTKDATTHAITVYCDHNGTVDPVTARTKAAKTALDNLQGFYDAQDATGRTQTYNSSELTDTNSAAYKLYSQLSAADRATLDQYVWQIRYTSGTKPVRIYLVRKDEIATAGFMMYKYDATADSTKGKFQTTDPAKPATGSAYNKTTGKLDPNAVKSAWGYVVDGNWKQSAWGELMLEKG